MQFLCWEKNAACFMVNFTEIAVEIPAFVVLEKTSIKGT